MNSVSNKDPMGRRDKEYFNKMDVDEARQWHRGIIDRIMQVYQFKEKKDLAEHIGCHQNMPSNWIQTHNVPWQVVHLCHKETGASLDWLYYGLQSRFELTPQQEQQCSILIEEHLLLAYRIREGGLEGSEALSMASKSLVREVNYFLKTGQTLKSGD